MATPPFWLARAMIVALRFGAIGGPSGVRGTGPDSLTRGPARSTASPVTRNRRKASAEGSSGRPATHATPTSRCGVAVGERQQARAGERRRRRQTRRGHDGHPEARRHEAAHGRQVVGLEVDRRLEAGGLRTGPGSGCACPDGAAAHDEGLVRDLGEGDGIRGRRSGWVGGTASTSGSTRMRRHSTPGPVDPVRRQLDVGAPGGELLRHPAALPHGGALEHHAHPGCVAAGTPGSAPGTSQEPEAQREGQGRRRRPRGRRARRPPPVRRRGR